MDTENGVHSVDNTEIICLFAFKLEYGHKHPSQQHGKLLDSQLKTPVSRGATG